MKRYGVFALILVFITPGLLIAEMSVYQAWAPWEVDAVVTAWAIKRHIDTGAVFIALPRGTAATTENTIDLPGSPYRRSGRRTAFDEVLRIHSIESACTRRIAPLVRLLEIAPWRKAENPRAEDFESHLRVLLPVEPGKGGLDAAFHYIDAFCADAGALPPITRQ